MAEPKTDLRADCEAMGVAATAINSIPTYHRRLAAWRWLTARVASDMAALWKSEHVHEFHWDWRRQRAQCECGAFGAPEEPASVAAVDPAGEKVTG